MDTSVIMAFLSPIASALIIWYIQRQYLRREKIRDEQIAGDKALIKEIVSWVLLKT